MHRFAVHRTSLHATRKQVTSRVRPSADPPHDRGTDDVCCVFQHCRRYVKESDKISEAVDSNKSESEAAPSPSARNGQVYATLAHLLHTKAQTGYTTCQCMYSPRYIRHIFHWYTAASTRLQRSFARWHIFRTRVTVGQSCWIFA
jgi:hypothetical protein